MSRNAYTLSPSNTFELGMSPLMIFVKSDIVRRW